MAVRLAKPSDWPSIAAAHRAQNERDGTDYPLTPLFGDDGAFRPNIFFALVQTRQDGSFGGCAYFEACAEMLLAGGDAAATAELVSHIDGVAYILRQRDIESLHCLVPKQLLPETKREGPIARMLRAAGLKRDDHRLGHFYRDLRR